MKRSWMIAAAVAASLVLWLSVGLVCADEQYPVPPPPLDDDYYPCAENCHSDMDTDPTPRELEDEHEDIVLDHAEQFRWCLDCHDADNRDVLHLQNGTKVEFAESYKLCGQCHGAKYRDWKEGIHGKRTGMWNGEKQYLLCAHCHNPHSPKFPSMKPEPPPKVPGGHATTHHEDTGIVHTKEDAADAKAPEKGH